MLYQTLEHSQVLHCSRYIILNSEIQQLTYTVTANGCESNHQFLEAKVISSSLYGWTVARPCGVDGPLL